MRAEVRRLHSPDVDDLRDHRPDPSDDFTVLIQVMVGPAGGEGEESFDVEVITPKRLTSRIAESGPVGGRHLLIVNTYDYGAISAWIERAVAACQGADWNEVAERVSRIGRWEFEDYSE